MAEFTTAEIQQAIAEAIKEKDFKAVKSLLEYLAVQDPRAAAGTYDTILFGMVAAAQRDGAE